MGEVAPVESSGTAAPSSPGDAARVSDALVAACFFFSGASGLLLEVLWVRRLILVFGSTTLAVSTVVAAFMAGLAVGAAAIGRRADSFRSPLRAYGLFEIGIAIYALLLPALLDALVPLYRIAWSATGAAYLPLSLFRFALGTVVLLLPTALMGATLPALSRHVARTRPGFGAAVGRLYAVNTAGAVAGCAAGGFLLLPGLGERWTLLCAVGADLAVGTAAILLARRPGAPAGEPSLPAPPGADPAPEGLAAPAAPEEPDDRHTVRLAAMAFALSGASAMALQVAWTRLLTLIVGPSVYAFTVILTLFLLGLAAGGAAGTRLLRRVHDDLAVYANCQVYVGILSWGTAFGTVLLPFAFAHGSEDPRRPLADAAFLVAATVGAVALAAPPGSRRVWRALLGALCGGGLAVGAALFLARRNSAGFLSAIAATPGDLPTVLAHLGDLVAAAEIAAPVVLPPTLLMGASFPFLVRGCAPALARVGRRVGGLYAANTVGSILGAFLGGFALVPLLGIRGTIAAAAGGSAAAAALAVGRRGPGGSPGARHHALGIAGLLVLALLLFPLPWNAAALSSGPYRHASVSGWTTWAAYVADHDGRYRRVVFYEEGLTTTVTVMRWPEMVGLRVNGKTDASSIGDMPTQVLSGHLPLLLAPGRGALAPRPRVCIVGFGSGVTVAAAETHAPASLACVEIEAAVLRAARFFRHVNRDLAERAASGAVRLLADDGRNWMLATEETYDVIISEPSNPWVTGASKLFTREFFEIARARLAPGGLYAQWVQMYGMDLASVRCLVRTFRAAFPHAVLFETIAGSDLLLVGSAQTLGLDPDEIARRAGEPAVAADLARLGIRGAGGALSHLVLDEEGVARFADAEPGPLNTDENAWIEHQAPRTVRRGSQSGKIQAALGEAAPGAWVRAAGGVADAAARGRFLRAISRGALERHDALEEARDHEVASRVLAAGAEATAAALVLAEAGSDPAARAEALTLRGEWRVRESLRREAEAFADWEEAIRIAPDHRDASLRLARFHVESGLPEQAAPLLRPLVEARPDDLEARALLGKALQQSEDHAGARETLAPVIEADPDGDRYPLARLYGGLAALRLRDPAAAGLLEAYLSMHASETKARRDYVEALRLAGREEEAAAQEAALEGEDAAQLASDDADEAWKAEPRDLARAERGWRRSIELNPYDVGPWKRLWERLRDGGETAEAEGLLRRMLARHPRSAWAAARLAYRAEERVLSGRLAPSEARSLLEEARDALRWAIPGEKGPLVRGEMRGRIRDLEEMLAGLPR
ncbi:MAG: fused MFS/spermidine synthase [Planctomycetales bacterium]|nr:fused MFS/spermidine synthase [Planctomycetales bacterium]